MKRLNLHRRASQWAQKGLSAIAVLAILVLLAGLAAAMFRLAAAMSLGTSASADLARAMNSAKSGIQWGAYQALKGTWTTCASTSQTLDLRSTTGFYVTVTCSSTAYNEGETSPGVAKVIRMYSIKSVACNGSSGSCPDAAGAANTGYVERQLQATFKK
jgi:MSHA biogenesis protein MshP